MSRILIITFDLQKKGELKTSYAIGCLLSTLKNYPKVIVDHRSINLVELLDSQTSEVNEILKESNFRSYDFIALSAYVWNEYLINPAIRFIKENGFHGKIILGGYQISYSDSSLLSIQYPECDIFIQGYAENSIIQAITEEPSREPWILKQDSSLILPDSPYLNGVIDIPFGTAMVRTETQRGCPYKCSFCAHRDLIDRKVRTAQIDKVVNELLFLSSREVGKINILDPVFNMNSSHYIPILEELGRNRVKSHLTFQTRIELLSRPHRIRFLELCSELNVTLEFGIQTIHQREFEVIERTNNLQAIQKGLELVNAFGIDHEASLIYGLPFQTVNSFQKSINYLKERHCQKISAFPLMLLKGTTLFDRKNDFQLEEEPSQPFSIPIVTKGNTFSRDDYNQMETIASGLLNDNRVKLEMKKRA